MRYLPTSTATTAAKTAETGWPVVNTGAPTAATAAWPVAVAPLTAVVVKWTALAPTVAEIIEAKVTKVLVFICEATATPIAGAKRTWASAPTKVNTCRPDKLPIVCTKSPPPKMTKMALATAAKTR